MRGLVLRFVRRVYHLTRADMLLSAFFAVRTAVYVPIVKRRHKMVLARLRREVPLTGKLKVLFVVNDCTKWKAQRVYDGMVKSSVFDPMVAVVPYGMIDGLDMAEQRAREDFRFFGSKGFKVVFAYSFDRHRRVSLRDFNPDFVFYCQPWFFDGEHSPAVVSKFALPCYFSYAATTITLLKGDCALPFHRFLFRYFVQDDSWVSLAENVRGGLSISGKVVPTGHPMLDVFKDFMTSQDAQKGPVVYAPHWSFPHKDNPNPLDISTFLWTGRAILDYARRHAEIKWAYKPHPVLKSALEKSGVMTKNEIEDYYHAWEQIGEVCYDGDYPELFMRSLAMITDCGSFLSEYACTGRPIVRLISEHAKVQPCAMVAKLYSTYYQVRKIEELEPVLDELLVKGNDPNREARQAAAKAMNLTGTDAAGNIIRHLEELIFG